MEHLPLFIFLSLILVVTKAIWDVWNDDGARY